MYDDVTCDSGLVYANAIDALAPALRLNSRPASLRAGNAPLAPSSGPLHGSQFKRMLSVTPADPVAASSPGGLACKADSMTNLSRGSKLLLPRKSRKLAEFRKLQTAATEAPWPLSPVQVPCRVPHSSCPAHTSSANSLLVSV